MYKIRDFVKNNIIFCIIILALIGAVKFKDSSLTTSVVSHPDASIAFSTKQKVLEQTWQPFMKKLSGVRIMFKASEPFQADVRMRFLSDDRQTVLAESVQKYRFEAGEEGELKFDCNDFAVEPGIRYRICLNYENVSGEGSLLLPAGTNYLGCTVDGNSSEMAAAFSVDFRKNSRIFWLAAVIFPFFAIALLLMFAGGRTWEEVIGTAFILPFIFLYLAGLFQRMEAGIWGIYFIAGICFILAVYVFNKKKLSIRSFFSPGIFLFAGLFFLILLNNRGTWLAAWDEYSHWGLAVKDMYYYNSFARHIGTSVALTRYPPLCSMIEYFFVYANGLFSVDILYVAFQTAMACWLAAVFKPVSHGTWKYAIPVMMIIFTVPAIFFKDFSNSIMPDSMMAVLIAYILICYYSEDISGFNFLRIVCGLFALILTKETGVIFAGLLSLIMVADTFLQYRNTSVSWKRKLWPIFTLGIVGIIFFSWQGYLSIPVAVENTAGAVKEVISQSNAISASKLSMKGIVDLLTMRADAYKYETIKNFIGAFFSSAWYRIAGLPFSFFDLTVLMVVCSWLISKKRFMDKNGKRLYYCSIFTFFAGLLYAAFLLVMYLFTFSKAEALMLHSVIRYSATWVCGVMIALLSLFVFQTAEIEREEYKKRGWEALLLLDAFLMISIPVENYVVKNMDAETPEELVYGYEDMAEVLRSFGDREEKVYFVCNKSDGFSNWIFKEEIAPMKTNLRDYDIYAGTEAFLEMDAFYKENGEEISGTTVYKSEEEWEEELKGYQYVFLMHPNEVFSKYYGELFEDPETVANGTFYKVYENGEKIMLHYIGRVGIKQWQ